MSIMRLLACSSMIATLAACLAPRDEIGTTNAYVTLPPNPSTIGSTFALLSNTPNLEGYWRLREAGNVLPPSGGTLQMFDQSSNDITGQYNGAVTLGVPGAIAGDGDTAATFTGGYAQVDHQKEYSLTRSWDQFDQYTIFGVPRGRTWGVNPNGESWEEQVTNQDDYGVQFGVTIAGDSTGVAYIDPGGASGSFQQGIPTTTTSLLQGEMQIRGIWSHSGTGTLQPISLVAQQVDVHNHVRAELVEHPDHTMELDLIKVVDGQNTYLSITQLDPTLYVNTPGDDWWFLRFRFGCGSSRLRKT